MLDLLVAKQQVNLGNEVSSAEDWQREARKLELQGKVEQAAAIRTTILHEKKVPWEILDMARFRLLEKQVLDPKNVSGKARQLCGEYAAYYDEPETARMIDPKSPQTLKSQRPAIRKKYWQVFESKNIKDLLRETDQYGVDFRNRFNQTPLMIAAQLGNMPIVKALLERGADRTLHDNYGRTAVHLAWLECLHTGIQPDDTTANLFSCLAPESISLRIGGRLIKLDGHIIEYYLFSAMITIFKLKYQFEKGRVLFGFNVDNLLYAFSALPLHIVPAQRRSRSYLNCVLARNEIARDYAYNRHLLLRMQPGFYVFNPAMDVKVGDAWVNIYDLLQLPHMVEHANDHSAWFLKDIQSAWKKALANPPEATPPPAVQTTGKKKPRKGRH